MSVRVCLAQQQPPAHRWALFESGFLFKLIVPLMLEQLLNVTIGMADILMV